LASIRCFFNFVAFWGGRSLPCCCGSFYPFQGWRLGLSAPPDHRDGLGVVNVARSKHVVTGHAQVQVVGRGSRVGGGRPPVPNHIRLIAVFVDNQCGYVEGVVQDVAVRNRAGVTGIDQDANRATFDDVIFNQHPVTVTAAGFSLDDADVQEILASNPSSASLTGKLIRLGIERASKPTPSAAGISTPQAQGQLTPSVEALTDEYYQKMMANRGKGSALSQIKAEYAKKGVPVDQVIFA